MQSDRCELVVIASPRLARLEELEKVVASGQVHSVILHIGESEAAEFTEFCTQASTLFHAHDIPFLIAGDTQLMGRCGADGIYVEQTSSVPEELELDRNRIVGMGGFKDRHQAMMAGENGIDFILFGKLGGDTRPEAHPRNLKLAEWWAQLIDIPCIVMAGTDTRSVIDCAHTGAEYVAVESALFCADQAPEIRLSEICSLLETHAPSLEGEPA